MVGVSDKNVERVKLSDNTFHIILVNLLKYADFPCVFLFCDWQASSFEEQAHAYKYLANYHLKANRLEKAYFAAQKCTEFFEVLC